MENLILLRKIIRETVYGLADFVVLENVSDVWVKQSHWHGNPALGLESYRKYFTNPFDRRKVPVFVYGKGNTWNYVVSAGNNSEYSYSGSFYPENPTIDQAVAIIDNKYKNNGLFK